MIDRIKQLLDWQQLSPTQFADRIGVGRPVVSHILSERNKPSLEVVQRIIAAFPDLSLPWLLSGSGDMLTTGALAAAVPAPTAAPTAPTIQAGGATATMPEPARPIGASPDSQPTPYQRASPGPGGAVPTRFRAGTTPFPTAPDAGATRFVANTTSVKPQSSRLAVTQSAEDVSPAPLPPEVSAPRVATVQAPEPAAVDEGGPAPVASPAALLAPPAMSEAASLAQVVGESLASPGKTIRRIVLFYTDGSFADFKPE